MTWKAIPEENERPAVPLSRSLEQVTKQLGVSSPASIAAVLSKWEKVAGDNVLEHSTVLAYTDRKLVLELRDPNWATQIRWLKNKLLGRLNEGESEPLVTDIVIRMKDGPRHK